MAVYPAVFALLAQRWESAPLLYVFGLPFAWVVLEWVRAHVISGFPWANLGYTQTPLNRLIQIADITGSLWAELARSARQYGHFGFYPELFPQIWVRGPGRLHRLRFAVRFLAFRNRSVTCKTRPPCLMWGLFREILPRMKNGTRHSSLKRSTGTRTSAWSAVKQAPVPDILVWPESAMPFFYGLDENLSPLVDRIVRQTGKPLLFGSIGVRPDGRQAAFAKQGLSSR